MSQTLSLWNGQPPAAEAADAEAASHRPYLISFPVRAARPTACVVVCPGGGYGTRADHEGEPIARWLNRLGVSACVLHYRVRTRHPGPLDDAKRAIRLVRYHAAAWGMDPARIGILGFSAGGHLAATASTLHDAGDPEAADPVDRRSSRPDASILCYPVISFTDGYTHAGSRANLLGPQPWDEATRKRLSPEHQVDARTPPAFLWHTADDGAVPAANVLLYAGALARHKVPFALHVFPSGHHGLGLAGDHPAVGQWTGLCAQWLKDLGFR
ncbi:MAG: alpha/beta hydrolase [Planctomycetes bacterium]|nr:alpha/beta hydrolase [Planctomycetota bacterium]